MDYFLIHILFVFLPWTILLVNAFSLFFSFQTIIFTKLIYLQVYNPAMSILFLLLFQNGDCGILMLCLSGLGLVLNCLDTNNLPFNSPRCLDMFGKLDKSLLISSEPRPFLQQH